MVGKFRQIFPTIGKIFRHFSNDWKKIFAPPPIPRPPSPARPVPATPKTFAKPVRFPPPASDIQIEGVEPPSPGNSHPLPAMNPATHHLPEGASLPPIACKRFSLAPSAGRRATVASIGPQGPVIHEPRTFLPSGNHQTLDWEEAARRTCPSGAPSACFLPTALGGASDGEPGSALFPSPRSRPLHLGKERQATATQATSNNLPISMPKTPPGRNRGTIRFPTWRKWDMKHLSTACVPSGPYPRDRHLPSRSDQATHEEKRPNVARKGYGFKLEKRLSERAPRRVFGMFLFQGAWPCLLHGTSTRRVFLFSRSADAQTLPGKPDREGYSLILILRSTITP